jgi:GNAT superfamily N-acetyltransferase
VKHSYFNMETRAIVECDPVMGIEVPEPERTWRICRVKAVVYGQGHGSEVMRWCLADADAEGIILTLEAIPYQHGKLEALLRFYERHGFVFGIRGTNSGQIGFRYPT